MVKKLLLVFAVLQVCVLNAQLSQFQLQLSKTDETCLGNGSITISVSNLTPQSTMLYKVYRLPDTTNAIAVTSSNSVGSLTAGLYLVVAHQYLNSFSNSQQQEIEIRSNILPFDFEILTANLNCSTGANITINSLSGIASSFEIISGPVVFPLQSLNSFNNLPSGVYNVRAFNQCGVAKVKTVTVNVAGNSLAISDALFPDDVSIVCDTIRINNTISAVTGTIGYPLTVKHMLDPMNIFGQQAEIVRVYSSGPADALEVSESFPRYAQDYTYTLQVTDNCGIVYQKDNIIVDADIQLDITTGNAPCSNKYLMLNIKGFMPPYTVDFLNAPAGFNILQFNAGANGPFSTPAVHYGHSENPVPFGTYTIRVTDACGRQIIKSYDVLFVPPTPSAIGGNNGCFSSFGRIKISIPDQKLVWAQIVAAPTAYTQPLPQNVTANINGTGALNLSNLPLGTYTITFRDDCGYTYTSNVEVPPYVEKDFFINTLPGCGAGLGSVRYRSGNGDFMSVIITAAPAAFGQALPYNANSYIDLQGDFYMAGLPAGTYTFKGTDVCGVSKEKTVTVNGYNPPQNPFVYTPNCASFSVKVTDSSNGTEAASYWLQKLDPVNNTWGHPVSGAAYAEGSVPAPNNSLSLVNNQLRANLNFYGKFRILKKFESFGNAQAANEVCLSVLGQFEYQEGLGISSAYSLGCIGEPGKIRIDAIGYPTVYRITKKNGLPFVVNNGTNNVFNNLDPAQYLFEVEDACGNIVNKLFDVQMLPAIADASRPMDMIICNDQSSSLLAAHTFHLTDQNPSVLGPLYSSMYSISYHLTQADADNGANPLPEYYTAASNGQTIYVRLIHNEIAICHGTTSFKLFVSDTPEPEITTTGVICDGDPITLTADRGYDAYLWSTGETTQSITVSQPGLYSVIVDKKYGNAICSGVTDVDIKQSVTPKIIEIKSSDWTEDQNTIVIETDNAAKYLFSIDGENYQEEASFDGLAPGVYKVFVKDELGCGLDMKEIVLMNYPKFFTPNGDGQNDKWHIKYSMLEPHMKIAIYDRYGKMVTTFGSSHEGWDGTENGRILPSTDYWFIVTREDGRELRGHFAMLR